MILEVKADFQIEDSVVKAKAEYATQLASSSNKKRKLKMVYEK